MPVLTGIDILGVQRFVFSSNRLRDVVTGSFLVHWSTDLNGALSLSGPTGSILFAGGGNAIIKFSSLAEAQTFAGRYTRLIYDRAPGIEVAIVHKEFENGNLALALQDIQIDLARKKTEHSPSVQLMGLSITASCMETAYPATGFDPAEPTVPVSRNILKRREIRDDVSGYWKYYLTNRECFAFPLDLDQLGRTVGDMSMIGVVHLDGNGVGEKIKNWLINKINEGIDDNTVCQQYQEWSLAIDNLGKEVFQAIVDRICSTIEINQANQTAKVTGSPAGLGFDLKQANGKWQLPLRPVLLGGDDLTFICDARIALDLTKTALCVYENSNIPHLGEIYASAGISIVRVRSPFSRAYEMSEKLCSSAKRMLKAKNISGCALDWHIGNAKPGDTVELIRERQYKANSYLLTCRPFRLGTGKADPETFQWLCNMLLDEISCGLRGNVWAERSNKVKALVRLAREGPDELKSALVSWQVVDKNLKLPEPIDRDGFIAKNRTPVLDAVELLDLYLVLEKENKDSKQTETER